MQLISTYRVGLKVQVLDGLAKEGLAASSGHLTHEEPLLKRISEVLVNMSYVVDVDSSRVQVIAHFP